MYVHCMLVSLFFSPYLAPSEFPPKLKSRVAILHAFKKNYILCVATSNGNSIKWSGKIPLYTALWGKPCTRAVLHPEKDSPIMVRIIMVRIIMVRIKMPNSRQI